MSDPNPFDFYYALQNTHVVVQPRNLLETFGTTTVSYHHLAEVMDSVNQVRIREGRVQAYRPQILTPEHFSSTLLEGFGEEAERYIDWLRSQGQHMAILQYGFAIRRVEVNEYIVSESLPVVVDRVMKEVEEKDDPLNALVVGVDDPWEVSLIKMMVDMAGRSAPTHARQLHLDPSGSRNEIELAFQAAEQNSTLIPRLGQLLKRYEVFDEYQDRFFALVKRI